MNASRPGDLVGSYRWSENLSDWYAANGLDGPGTGRSVQVTTEDDDTMRAVTATPSEELDRLFLQFGVTQTP
jgi:hypothetical protein